MWSILLFKLFKFITRETSSKTIKGQFKVMFVSQGNLSVQKKYERLFLSVWLDLSDMVMNSCWHLSVKKTKENKYTCTIYTERLNNRSRGYIAHMSNTTYNSDQINLRTKYLFVYYFLFGSSNFLHISGEVTMKQSKHVFTIFSESQFF